VVRLEVEVRDPLNNLLLGVRLGVDIKVDVGVRDMEDLGQEYA
jgi:hypothetical protein